jgi:ATP-binding cassette subfamily C protein LapB
MTMASRPASAGVMASHMKEFETLRDFFTSATMSTLVDLPFTLLFIAFIGIIGGYLALIPLLAIPLILGLGWAFQKPLQRITRESMHESALKNALLFESITGLETIKLHAAEGHVQRKWEELTERASRTSVKSKKLSSLAMNLALFIQQMVSNLVVVAGVYLIASGHLTMGGLVGSVILVGRAVAPLAQAAGLMTRFNQSKEGLSQLNKLMERPVERPDDKHFIAKPTIEGRIEFKNVNFKYPNQSVMALSDVSFSIEAGERVAIIGAIGSGKTTISRLLLNLFQATDGTVQLDGTDVRQIDPADLRRSIGIVQQDAQLFYGSIRDNINMGHEMVSERALVRAAEMSGVMEFIRDTQHGLDTAVGERGESLSGGQRQAVAVARALLYDPPILLLDEPTASMDPTSEAMLMKRLDQLTKGRTMILITHKGAMLQLVDKIILMDKSRVIAFGGRDEIIARLQNRDYSTQGGK